jgi:tRNA threonylcarbamoyladenosine biosynthesis protein TsaB
VLILAFDTSGFAGSVAVLERELVLAEASLPAEQRSAQTLAPAIVEALRSAGVEAKQVRLVATSVGPGSFTGLRVGVTTAKTFAYAVRAEVMGVSTLETIAHQAPIEGLSPGVQEIQVVLDAQRKELFWGRFAVGPLRERTAGLLALRRLAADRLVAAEEWLLQLNAEVVVTGSGLKKLQQRLPSNVVSARETTWEPRAATIGQLAWRDYQLGRRDDVWKLAPMYLRASYAEEKAMSARQPDA